VVADSFPKAYKILPSGNGLANRGITDSFKPGDTQRKNKGTVEFKKKITGILEIKAQTTRVNL
jgi:hypothetical protein